MTIQHLDASENVFFERELEHVKSRAYDIKYPEFKAQQFIPVNEDVDEGATSITYPQYDGNGVSKFIADYADDIPNIEVSGKEFTTPVREHANFYQFTNKEIRAAAKVNKPLKSMKANKSRRAYEQIVDDTAWLGDGSADFRGLTGIVYNPNVNIDPAPNGAWASGTPDEIIADVNFAINRPVDVTNGVEEVDTVLLSVSKFTQIASTRVTDTNETILSFLQKVHPAVTFASVAKLKALDPKPSGGAGPVEVILAFKSSADNLTLEIPMDYTQHPPQTEGLVQKVYTEGSTGGVIIYYPLSVQIVEGI
tara:strand:- start:2504 stop:3427 length:924 start_codon:yes stop_codon:yes gene_type:complete